MPSIIKVDQIQSDTGTVNQTSNLSFTGTGRRITGDMSNATLTSRVAFQTSTTNGNTIVNALPNGTSQISRFIAHNNSDPTNCAVASLDARSTEVALFSAINGTGTYLPLTMYTGGSERMRITTAGVVELTSGQLKFPASQNASADANTLDDYEEGTFTPTVILGGGSVTYTTQTGSYTKIGRLTTVQIGIAVNVVTSPSSTVEIGGLPFAISATQKGAVAIFVSGMTATAKVFVGRATAGTSVLRLFTYDVGTTANPGADFANGCSLNITASYES